MTGGVSGGRSLGSQITSLSVVEGTVVTQIYRCDEVHRTERTL